MGQTHKTILDILLERNRITETEAAQFSKDLSNIEIEKKLRENNLATAEDIAKSYAVIYDLPFIRLENYNISAEAYQIIPEDLIRRYQIICFDKEGQAPGGRLKIAVAKAGELKDNPPDLLAQLKEKKGVTVDLYITTPEDIETVVKRSELLRSEQPAKVSAIENKTYAQNPTNGLKSVDLKILKIPYEVISKFPVDISKKYKNDRL